MAWRQSLENQPWCQLAQQKPKEEKTKTQVERGPKTKKQTEKREKENQTRKEREREHWWQDFWGQICMPISKIEVQKHERCLPSNDNFKKLHSSEPNLATNIYKIGSEKYQLQLWVPSLLLSLMSAVHLDYQILHLVVWYQICFPYSLRSSPFPSVRV